jgi:beta-lactamase regulating signal transducer with metallopeptidase domain/Flp pilus assembly protein TadD
MNLLVSLLEKLAAALPLFTAIVTATIVLGIAQLMIIAMPRLSAAGKHLILMAAMTSFLVINISAVLLPKWTLAVLPPVAVTAPAKTPEPVEALVDPKPADRWSKENLLVRDGSAMSTPAATPTPDAPPQRNWSAILFFAWITVTALLLLRLVLGVLRVWWIIRVSDPAGEGIVALANDAREQLGLDRTVDIYCSTHVHVPMIWGVFRPALLLPSGANEWEREQLAAVVMHELGHLKRWDFLTLIVSNLVTSFFWFHPQVWFADLSVRRECERACDDLVLGSGTRASDYAAHLLSIVRMMPEVERFGAVTLAMSHRSQLEGRLLSILHPGRRRGALAGRAIGATTLVTCLVVGLLATIRLTASPSPDPLPSPRELRGEVRQAVSDARGAWKEAVSLVKGKKEYDKKDEWRDGEEHSGRDWYDHGMDLHHRDLYPEAIAAFERSNELGYKRGASLYNIACGYALMNDRDQALQFLQRAINAGFDDPDHLFEDSDLDPIRSDARFQSLVAPYRNDYETNRRNDDDEEKSQSSDRVRAALEQYESTAANDGEGWASTGVALLRVRELDKAIIALNNAARLLRYENSTAYYNLACAYALNGNSEQALDALQRAISAGFDGSEKMSNDPDLRSIRGTARFADLRQQSDDLALWQHQARDQRNYKDNYSREMWAPAVEHYTAYTRTHPDSGRAWFNLGFALHYSSRHAEAITAFQQAIRNDYRVPTASYNVACAYAKLNDAGNAFQWLARARDAGFELKNYILNDEDLAGLRNDARFAPYREAAEREQWKHKLEKEHKHEKNKSVVKVQTDI